MDTKNVIKHYINDDGNIGNGPFSQIGSPSSKHYDDVNSRPQRGYKNDEILKSLGDSDRASSSFNYNFLKPQDKLAIQIARI